MGRPRRLVRTPPRPMDRRGFFKRMSAGTVALATVPLLPACGSDDDDSGGTPAAGSGNPPAGPAGQPAAPAGPRLDTRTFQHGVASGDPLADRVILWTRVTPTGTAPVTVEYVVATDPALTNVVRSGRLSTDAERDFTVKTDANGLRPETTYYFRFTVGNAASPVGRTRTLPVGGASRLRIAVASCASLAHGYFNAYRRIAERADLDLVVHLGDYIYEYATGEYGNVRPYEPATEIVTLADYRTRHAQYKRDADLQEVHRQHPMVAIWDDHEVTNDTWVLGAENHTEGAEGNYEARVSAGLKAYYEWMPVRVVDPSDPRRINRSFSFGDLVDLIMLEERLVGRSEQATPRSGFTQTGVFADPSRTLLGAEQEDWLAAKLRGSRAKWKLVGQGVMFAQWKRTPATLAAGGGTFFNSDQWDGYQPARDRVYAVLKGTPATPASGSAPATPAVPGVGNVVILTGDIHTSWAADLSQDPNNPDVASGGYDPATGTGSRAVEFIGTSITSQGGNDPEGRVAAGIRANNPHFKYVELTKRGYMVVDVDPSRVVCEWWHVDSVAQPSVVQTLGAAFQVVDGTNRLAPATQTPAKANPPALAPAPVASAPTAASAAPTVAAVPDSPPERTAAPA